MIKNKLNNKVYIGQSINIERRWVAHRSFGFNENNKDKKAYHSYLYRSFRKYGLDNFEFLILEECSKEELDYKEAYYINYYKSYKSNFGYNLTTIINKSNYNSKNWNDENFKELKKMLRNFDLPIKYIADFFNVSISTINYINKGEVMIDLNETYPIRDSEEYKKYLKEKNNKKVCIQCNKKFYSKVLKRKQKFCSKECENISKKENSLENKISKDELEYLIIRFSFEKIAKDYKVSGNLIKKLCKKYNLPYKKSDIKIIYSKEIEKFTENKSIKQAKNIKYPNFKEIYEESFNFKSFAELSRYFNIDDTTFRWYLKKNKLPYNIKDIRNYYNK